MFDVEMPAYDNAPASEPTLTTPSEVIKAIKGIKCGKSRWKEPQVMLNSCVF
jgi:hypothetical protein